MGQLGGGAYSVNLPPAPRARRADQIASQLAAALARANDAEMKAQVEQQRNARMQAEWSAAVVIQGQFRRRELQQRLKKALKRDRATKCVNFSNPTRHFKVAFPALRFQ